MKRFLALSVMLFLLLRPLCEVQAAGFAYGEPGSQAHATASYHGDEAVPCCAELEDGSLAIASLPAVALGDGKLAFAAPVLSTVHFGGGSGAVVRQSPGVLPPSLSFYARSARIRR
jgi:hypothetical protein